MSCAFYRDLPDNPNIEQIKKQLIATVVIAQRNAMPAFKRRIKSEVIRSHGKLSDDALETAFVFHTSDIAYAVEDQFSENSAIMERVKRIFANPELAGLDRERIEGGFYHMGYVYAIYWYGITGTVAEPHTCVSLNHMHADEIEKSLREVDIELGRKGSSASCSASKKIPSWLCWLLILIIGILIGVVSQSCS